MGIPNRLKEVRKAAGLTQAELAHQAHVARAIIVGIENGSIKVVRTNTLTKIADALDERLCSIFFTE